MLQVLRSIRSEPLLLKPFDHDVLFRCFVRQSVDDPGWVHSTFTKHRYRLLTAAVTRKWLRRVVRRARRGRLLPNDDFKVDRTLMELWAAVNNMHRRGGLSEPVGSDSNPTVNVHGERRAQETRGRQRRTNGRLGPRPTDFGSSVLPNESRVATSCRGDRRLRR